MSVIAYNESNHSENYGSCCYGQITLPMSHALTSWKTENKYM